MRRTRLPNGMTMPSDRVCWGSRWPWCCSVPVAAAPAAVPETVGAPADCAGPTAAGRARVPPGEVALALVFYSSECPISNAYSPTLNRLVEEFPAKSLRLVGVCVDPDLSAAEVAAHAKDFGLKFPVVHDKDVALAAQVGATVTPEAFVIDDQGRSPLPRPDRRPVRRAAEAERQLDDPRAARRHRRRPGGRARSCPRKCRRSAARSPSRASRRRVPTYTGDVAAILQKNCLECHRRGQVGPFPLETYAQASKRADDIAAVSRTAGCRPGRPRPRTSPRFKHDRSLSAGDIATLAAWAEGGAPEGRPRPRAAAADLRGRLGPRHARPRRRDARRLRDPRRRARTSTAAS